MKIKKNCLSKYSSDEIEEEEIQQKYIILLQNNQQKILSNADELSNIDAEKIYPVTIIYRDENNVFRISADNKQNQQKCSFWLHVFY